jgi:hypothetical protein
LEWVDLRTEAHYLQSKVERLIKEIPHMSLISLIVILVVVGFALWGINSYIPMQAGIKKIMNVVVIIVVAIWLLSVFGVIGDLGAVHVGHVVGGKGR